MSTISVWVITLLVRTVYFICVLGFTVKNIVWSKGGGGNALERHNRVFLLAGGAWLWSNIGFGLILSVVFSILSNKSTGFRFSRDSIKFVRDNSVSYVYSVECLIQSIVGVLWLWSRAKLLLYLALAYLVFGVVLANFYLKIKKDNTETTKVCLFYLMSLVQLIIGTPYSFPDVFQGGTQIVVAAYSLWESRIGPLVTQGTVMRVYIPQIEFSWWGDIINSGPEVIRDDTLSGSLFTLLDFFFWIGCEEIKVCRRRMYYLRFLPIGSNPVISINMHTGDIDEGGSTPSRTRILSQTTVGHNTVYSGTQTIERVVIGNMIDQIEVNGGRDIIHNTVNIPGEIRTYISTASFVSCLVLSLLVYHLFFVCLW